MSAREWYTIQDCARTDGATCHSCRRENGPCSIAGNSTAYRKLDCLVSVCLAQGPKFGMKTHSTRVVHGSRTCGRPLRQEWGNYKITYVTTKLLNIANMSKLRRFSININEIHFKLQQFGMKDILNSFSPRFRQRPGIYQAFLFAVVKKCLKFVNILCKLKKRLGRKFEMSQ